MDALLAAASHDPDDELAFETEGAMTSSQSDSEAAERASVVAREAQAKEREERERSDELEREREEREKNEEEPQHTPYLDAAITGFHASDAHIVYHIRTRVSSSKCTCT